MNINFSIKNSTINEKSFKINHQSPKEYCEILAYEKANNISKNYKNSLVIGADTIVYHKNKIIGKPLNKKEAFAHLKSLSNSSHYVYTAVSLICKVENINEKIIDRTIVTFNKLNSEDIKYYVNNYKPMTRAGSYGIQDWNSVFIKKINGCYYNVVGFPIAKFYKIVCQNFEINNILKSIHE